eukprot:8013951-Heterocapsa_arctica.AAC.1
MAARLPGCSLLRLHASAPYPASMSCAMKPKRVWRRERACVGVGFRFLRSVQVVCSLLADSAAWEAELMY